MSGKVTALKRQQKRRDRVNVFLDGEYSFGLQSALAAKLSIGQELSDQEIDALRRQDGAERAYARALHYLSFRPRSEREMQRHLQKKELDSETIETVLSRLRRAGLVDDLEFARYWVENRETFRPRGHWGLRAELRQKGVAAEIIDLALQDVDEETSAMRVAKRRVRRLAHLDERTFRRRLLGLLQRRGFGYEVSRRVTDCLWHQVETGQEPDPD